MASDVDDYHCNKTSFAKAYKLSEDPVYLERIQGLIRQCQSLVFYTSHCLKYYILRQENYDVGPLTGEFINKFMYLINDDFKPRKQEDRDKVAHIRPFVNEYLSKMTHLYQTRYSIYSTTRSLLICDYPNKLPCQRPMSFYQDAPSLHQPSSQCQGSEEDAQE